MTDGEEKVLTEYRSESEKISSESPRSLSDDHTSAKINALADYNPWAVFVCLAGIVGIAMFAINPVMQALCLCGGLLYFCITISDGYKTHLWYLLLFVLCTFINPLFNHNGKTVLLVINDRPFTFEALLFGLLLAAMIVSVLYWFRVFSAIMSAERLQYLCGRLSPKAALLLSLTLRYIPLYKRQLNKTRAAQQALGQYSEEKISDRLRGGFGIFSIMTTWALENGIITADSMTARGYGSGRRTRFVPYAWHKRDIILLILSLLLIGSTVSGLINGAGNFEFYPSLRVPEITAEAVLTWSVYGVLVLLPSLIELKETVKWKYLMSKI